MSLSPLAPVTPHVVHLTSVHQSFDQRIFHKECRTLAQAGFRVTLVAPGDYVRRVQDGVEILGVSRAISRRQRIAVWREILARVRLLQPDLVHFHDPELLTLVPALRAALGSQTPLIYDVHEYFVDSFAHKVWIPPALRGFSGRSAALLERRLGRTVDGLVFVVEEQASFYTGWRAARTVVHNYPIAASFGPAVGNADVQRGAFTMIHLGSLFARRGIMTMLEAMPAIVAEASNARLILGGNFESGDFRRQVHDFIAAHDLGDHVRLVKWIDYDALGATLARADAGWVPMPRIRQYERPNVPTKLLEFMLAGLPVVTSDNPHAADFVKEAEAGLVVTADDPAAHAAAMLELYRHPEARRAMGARGRALVLDRYTWEQEGAKLIAFYEALLQKARR
jgi:glycosyltransferase involved in cell wall biosynthesis